MKKIFCLILVLIMLTGCFLDRDPGYILDDVPDTPDPKVNILSRSSKAYAINVFNRLCQSSAGKNVLFSPLALEYQLMVLREFADENDKTVIDHILDNYPDVLEAYLTKNEGYFWQQTGVLEYGSGVEVSEEANDKITNTYRYDVLYNENIQGISVRQRVEGQYEWLENLKQENIKKGVFYNSDKTTTETDYYSLEVSVYYQNENYYAFSQKIKGSNYRMIWIIPIQSTGTGLISLAEYENVFENKFSNQLIYVQIPQIKRNHEADLKDVIASMGLETNKLAGGLGLQALEQNNSFTVNTGNVTIQTQTSVQLLDYSEEDNRISEIILNRPFEFFVVDSDYSPVFMGYYDHVENA